MAKRTRSHKYACPACGARTVELVELNYRQQAYNMGTTMQKWAAPDWEKIPEEAVSFQAVCGGASSSLGCGFAAQRFQYHPTLSQHAYSGKGYRKTPAAARGAAKVSLHKLQAVLSMPQEETANERKVNALLNGVDLDLTKEDSTHG